MPIQHALAVALLALALATPVTSAAQERLDVPAVREVLQKMSARLEGCAQGERRTVVLKIVVTPNGRVGEATAEGDAAGTPVGRCLERRAKAMRFAKSGKSQTIRFPVHLPERNPPARED